MNGDVQLVRNEVRKNLGMILNLHEMGLKKQVHKYELTNILKTTQSVLTKLGIVRSSTLNGASDQMICAARG